MDFITTVYENIHDCVSWSGRKCEDNNHFSEFLSNQTFNRLNDIEGKIEYSSYLKGLPLSGLGVKALAEVLEANQPEDRQWAAAEAFAEAFLETHKGVQFPWNMERDKRNPFGSLPGADIIGFSQINGVWRLVLGEVKSSSELRYPPQVMSGRSGHMGHQIDELVHNLSKVNQLFKWLIPRVKDTRYEDYFNVAATNYFNSGKKSIILYGILVRDTDANEQDLLPRGEKLRKGFSPPTICELIAFYLPWSLQELTINIQSGGGT